LRIVVQYVHGDLDSPWHLVAYGGSRAFRPQRFRSVEDLMTLIRSTVPDFDPSHLAIKTDSRESYIVWTGDMALNESQLSALGLSSEIDPK
jgi:hypothetical protein